MIAIVDYGLGNISAFANLLKRLNVGVAVAKNGEALERASKIILPGVGAFDHAMEKLDASGMRPTLERLAVVEKMPLLGVCVGMQMLARSSEEGIRPGLGWVPGTVKSLRSRNNLDLPMPHMGWNDVNAPAPNKLFQQLDASARFYFLHSFYFDADNASDVVAVTDYGGRFACAVNRENLFGVQFHPEKSHQFGIQLLKNFADL